MPRYVDIRIVFAEAIGDRRAALVADEASDWVLTDPDVAGVRIFPPQRAETYETAIGHNNEEDK